MIKIGERITVKWGVGPKTHKRLLSICDGPTSAIISVDDDELDALARESEAFKSIEARCIDLRVALADMIRLIDEHGDRTIKAHATRILEAHKTLARARGASEIVL
jgi:hypothetical protein